MDLQELRDLVLVIFAIAGTVLFVISAVVLLSVGVVARSLIVNVNRAVQEGIVPTVRAIRETVNTIRGTTSYISQTAVSPLMRGYAALAALRKASKVMGGRRRPKGDRGE